MRKDVEILGDKVFKLYDVIWNMDRLRAYTIRDTVGMYDYDDIICALHPDVDWLAVYDDGYQGDFFYCGTDGEKWYFIEGYFGSCSACDWLQGVVESESIDEWYELLTHFKKTIIVKNTKEEIIEYMKQTKENAVSTADLLEKLIEKVKAYTGSNGEDGVKEEKPSKPLGVINLRGEADIPRSEAREMILDYIVKHPGCWTSDIIIDLELDTDFVVSILQELKSEGEIEVKRGGGSKKTAK